MHTEDFTSKVGGGLPSQVFLVQLGWTTNSTTTKASGQ